MNFQQIMSKNYRELTAEEIDILKINGCFSREWSSIKVVERGFTVDNLRGVTFGGEVRLGANQGGFANHDKIEQEAGIYNAQIINCTIGDNVYISGISSYIANYNIGDNAYIEGVGRMVCRGESAFGNGTMVATINENGGRSVPIYNEITAQIAYIMAMYRHRPKMVEAIRSMVESYCDSLRSDRGTIEEGARITNSNIVEDVNVGSYAVIDGVSRLQNGSINSSKESPARMGSNVEAIDFILSHGAIVDSGATINRCYVGEASTIGLDFMATDSLFFSNSNCANGEAASIFAGPYTVSGHKSSLLIAGYFLFFNAGSGSNQSNHLFRMGPVHQGIHERGTKFGSNAYVMLPAKEGPYTVVIGRHNYHHNTESFPYSYLLEEDGRSYLLPGINLRNYGTLRDLDKWEERDNRGALKRDKINFKGYNPYIGSRILSAIYLSEQLLTKDKTKVYSHKNVRIKQAMLKRGLKLYQKKLNATVGYLLSEGYSSAVDADKQWLDLAGMFAGKESVVQILDSIESGKLSTLDEVQGAFNKVYSAYGDHAFAWAKLTLTTMLDREPTESDIEKAIKQGREADRALRKMREEDALKDIDTTMQTSYGIDSSDEEERKEDFKNVRNI